MESKIEYKTIKRLSPSSIIKFLSDYKGWYKNYVLGEKEPNNVYFEFGTAFHGMLEDFFIDKPHNQSIKEYTTMKYNELWKKWFEDNTTLKSFMDESLGITMSTASEWTYNYLKQWVTETLPLEKKYGSDKAFQYNSPSLCEWHLEDEELHVHGYADAYYGKDKFNISSGTININMVEDDFNPSIFGAVMSDYKTSKVDRNTNNTKYVLQALIYALMYTRINKRKKMQWVCIDYLKYNTKFFYYVTPSMLSSIEKLINDVWLQVVEINNNPEKYFDAPPDKKSLKEYI